MKLHLHRVALDLRTREGSERAVWRLDRTRLDDALASIAGPAAANADRTGPFEGFVLATCARSEVWIAGPDLLEDSDLRELFARLLVQPATSGNSLDESGALTIPPATSASDLYALQIEIDEEAILRLFRIAAGLDSPLIGESEILGQLRYALARGVYRARESLRPLGERAVATGRAARRLSGLRIDYVRAINQLPPLGATVLRSIGVVGSGRFAADLARGLRSEDRQVTLFAAHVEKRPNVNRGGLIERRPLDELGGSLDTLDLLVTAARLATPLINASRLESRSRPLRIVDLGVPPNVEPAVGATAGVELVTLDALWRFPRNVSDQAAAARAEEVASQGAKDFSRAQDSRERLGRRRLILAAHGAGDGSPVNRAIQKLAVQVAERLRRLPVETAFHLGTPPFASLAGCKDAIVLPLLTSEGLFQRRLEAAVSDGPTVLPPLGADPRLLSMLVHQLEERLGKTGIGPDEVAVLVVGHGTGRTPTSGDATRALACAIQEALPAARVEAAFLDQEPRIEDVARRLGEGRPALALVPFVLGAGRTREDIEARLPEGSRPRILLPSLIEAPRLAQVVTSIVCGQTRVLRLGTRSSLLALWQARRVATDLGVRGVPVTLVPVRTAGDRDLNRPLGTPEAAGLFTDELEALLLAGEIDLAVHSLKDLPLAPRSGIEVAAILPRAAAHEVLVSHSGRALRFLPPGARIGTSSPRRRGQLLSLRPDVCPEPLRGGVDARLRRVAEGEIDAALFAAAGLERLGLSRRITEHFSFDDFLPEAGQGALAVQVRRGDVISARAVARLEHRVTRLVSSAERRSALRLGQALPRHDAPAIAAFAELRRSSIRLRVRLLDAAGCWRLDATGEGESPNDVADRTADLLVERWRRQRLDPGEEGSRRVA